MSTKADAVTLFYTLAAVLVIASTPLAAVDRISEPFEVIESRVELSEVRARIQPDLFSEAEAVSERWRLKVPAPATAELSLELEPFNVVAPDARFLIGSPSGDSPLAAPDIVMFRGKLEGRPNSFAFVALSSTGLINGYVSSGEDAPYLLSTLPSDLKAGERILTVRRAGASAESEVPFCVVLGDSLPAMPQIKSEKMMPGNPAGPTLLRVAIEGDQAFVNLFPGVLEARDYIVQLIAVVSSIYERDLNTRLVLALARLWPDGNAPFNAYDIAAFWDYWKAYEDTTDLNLVAMFSGVRDAPYAGIGYLGAHCRGAVFSIEVRMNGSFVAPMTYPDAGNNDIILVAHEMGHNVGAYHTHDFPVFDPPIDQCGNGIYTRGTLMSYCHTGPGAERNHDLRFHRRVQMQIEDVGALVGCHRYDCNGNGVYDDLEIAAATSADVNDDGIPDECQDCNNNGTLDPVDITGGAPDADGNGIPDECEADCDGNGLPDQYETWEGLAPDLDGNNSPDQCDPDCNSNGVVDYVEINLNMNLDLNRNLKPDECDDCNDNDIPDWVDLGRPHNLYVCEPQSSRVTEIQGQGAVLERTFGSFGTPRDIVASVDGQYLFVADEGLNTVIRIDVSAGTSATFVAAGAGGLESPTGVAIGAGGDLFASDFTGNCVRRYSGADGSPLGVFVAAGSSPLAGPRGLVFGPNGNLFVAGNSSHAVYEYNGTTGAYIGPFAGPDAHLSAPTTLAFLLNGNLLVCSNGTAAILEYDGTSGEFVRTFNDETPLASPWGATVGPNGNVFVTSLGGAQGFVYEYEPAAGRRVSIFVRGVGLLNDPAGLCFLPGSSGDVNGNYMPDICEAGDLDGDVFADYQDNCPGEPNPSQADGDSDGRGDACDNCLSTPNPDQRDVDADGYGDLCDNCPSITNTAQTDSDGDGRGHGCDNCQGDVNADQTDSDGDLIGDVCDLCPTEYDNDRDGDGLCGEADNCRWVHNPSQEDFDLDGMGDACDSCTDSDGDYFGDPGFPTNSCPTDNCPGVPNSYGQEDDADGDGAGDACDICPGYDDKIDSDGDGIPDGCDSCPEDRNPEQGCCCFRVGDANGVDGDEPTIGDVSLIIDALFITATEAPLTTPPACMDEADINLSSQESPAHWPPAYDDITVGDISALINYMFITGPSLGLPECP